MWFYVVTAVTVAVLWMRWRASAQTPGVFLASRLVYAYARLWHRLRIDGPGRIPGRGPAIVVANHTCGADSAFLTACSPRPLSFLIAAEYGNIPLLSRLLEAIACVPVQRHGQDVSAVRLSLRRLREGRALCIFPEGGLSRAGRSGCRRGKGGAALLALRSRAPVIPALIRGGPQTHAVARAWLRSTRVRVTLGHPIDLTDYDGRAIDRRLVEEITGVFMRSILALAKRDEPRLANGAHHDR
jgi:1-acyl-sn-glycerol-3-phosphate acyltransferase